jgi:nucleotide-binding universal stress UspA family protein
MKVEKTRILEVISPSVEVAMPKAEKDLSMTPKRKRMVNVLDVLETIKTSNSTPKKAAEASETHIEAEAVKVQIETEAGPSEPAKEKSLEIGEKMEKEAAEVILTGKTAIPILEASSEAPDYIIRHASGKKII